VKTVADPVVLESLVRRLRAVQLDTPRRWGTLTPHEMLCHLGDAAAMVVGTRPRKKPLTPTRRPIRKAIGLWTPIPWPQGFPTNPAHDPKADGTRPTVFESDRARALEGLEAIARAVPNGLAPAHGFFGTMSSRDWQRWAYRHTDHHLRQFGL
jgi:hypothetical protein